MIYYTIELLKKVWKKTGSVIKTILFAVVFAFVFERSIYGGFVYFALFIIALTLWKLWVNRVLYVNSIHQIQTMIWGKPLIPELWEGEQLPKIKLVWKKKNENNTK